MIDKVGMVRRAPYALALLRIVSGLIFLAHGTQKFLGFPAGDAAGTGWTFSHPGHIAGLIELVAGVLITLGLLTRPAAFIASGTMAAAYFIGHAPQNFCREHHGRRTLLYCFVLSILCLRVQAWSIDGLETRTHAYPSNVGRPLNGIWGVHILAVHR